MAHVPVSQPTPEDPGWYPVEVPSGASTGKVAYWDGAAWTTIRRGDSAGTQPREWFGICGFLVLLAGIAAVLLSPVVFLTTKAGWVGSGASTTASLGGIVCVVGVVLAGIGIDRAARRKHRAPQARATMVLAVGFAVFMISVVLLGIAIVTGMKD
ncbi:DUF2510 domain-containing protein [Cryobacterium algoricola]|uniref:DUF2510 domain-containing protein n=1 Tax=Cryobacterium algoricola TaxID=1259183 RepID=A0ABY2IGA1_9MICO|nr:DUF2510 domain-containing protein [Cryobacterium algoricola]TFB87672.1 DUF2510 domain-containing protein [Cryobacterium algoricola]